jgi:hypothetical protein
MLPVSRLGITHGFPCPRCPRLFVAALCRLGGAAAAPNHACPSERVSTPSPTGHKGPGYNVSASVRGRRPCAGWEKPRPRQTTRAII